VHVPAMWLLRTRSHHQAHFYLSFRGNVHGVRDSSRISLETQDKTARSFRVAWLAHCFSVTSGREKARHVPNQRRVRIVDVRSPNRWPTKLLSKGEDIEAVEGIVESC